MNNVLQSVNYKDDVNFNYSLSLSDLLLVTGWQANDVESVERVLYENGIDVPLGWHTERLLHRNLQNKVVDTLLFSGVQRCDDKWRRVGMSLEDQIVSTKDAFLRAELMTMNRRSNFSGDLIDKYGEKGDEVVC